MKPLDRCPDSSLTIILSYDPSTRFLEKPDIVQGHNSPFISVSWTDNYIDKGKCVDYFYVEVRDDSKA